MTETRADFELSKLAKEAGFDWLTNIYYEKETSDYMIGGAGWFDWNSTIGVSAPTLSHLSMWLREVHGLHCAGELSNVISDRDIWVGCYSTLNNPMTLRRKLVLQSGNTAAYFDAHDLALSAALTEACKIIIERKKTNNEPANN